MNDTQVGVVDIFVTVEQCLYLKDEHSKTAYLNEGLVGALQNLYMSFYNPRIVFWSEGGPEFASWAAFQYMPHNGIHKFAVATMKDARLVAPWDIVVDSEPFECRGKLYTPRAFVQNWGTSN